ncbi:hypothetical protein PPYR_03986 [Photinus pyralis]|uniref:Uncharacterized protein n=1 Tax=Photinus pyralis TaxID=7054 RepID=A0A5N4AXB8_PHOPY|nr:hypothetical protein PPYR_03986 [Photinus pyralis]
MLIYFTAFVGRCFKITFGIRSYPRDFLFGKEPIIFLISLGEVGLMRSDIIGTFLSSSSPKTKTKNDPNGNRDVKKNLFGSSTKKMLPICIQIETAHTTEDLVNYLRDDFPEVACEQLPSKFPQHYSSFKITLDLHNYNNVLKEDYWPSGTYVSRFFQKRQVKTVNS